MDNCRLYPINSYNNQDYLNSLQISIYPVFLLDNI
nr:MAG TPA: hypothetical protein [Bacteriophage sp.]